MLQLDRLPRSAEEVTDDDSIAHSNISQALGKIGDARAVPALRAIAASVSRGNTGALCGLSELAARNDAAGKAAVQALTELAKKGTSADARMSEQAQGALDELKGDHEEVQAAISGGAIEERNEHGRTPLYVAAESFSLASLELLIKEGADVSTADNNGYTPVIAVIDKASRYGKIPDEGRQCLDALLGAGADVNARTKTGKTAIFFVVDLKMTKALLKAGAEVNLHDEEGWTPLHGVVFRGKVPIAKLLIKDGADVNAKNAKGKSPADMLSANRKAMEALLVESGATV